MKRVIQIGIVLPLFLSLALTATSESPDSETVRNLLISAWIHHLDLRSSIQYDYVGQYLLPDGVKGKHEAIRQRELAETGIDLSTRQDHSFSGFYATRWSRQVQFHEAIALKDGRQLESVLSASDGTTQTLRNLGADRVAPNPNGAKEVVLLSPPGIDFEWEVKYLHGATPFLDWLKTTAFTVEERVDPGMGDCYVLTSERRHPGRLGESWVFKDEFWIARSKGLLPFRWKAGPGVRDGVEVKPAMEILWGITEVKPGVFLLTSMDADMPTQDYSYPFGKFQAQLSAVQIGDDVALPDPEQFLATAKGEVPPAAK